MRTPLSRLRSAPRVFVALAVAYAVLRIIAALQVHNSIVYYDSGEYRAFENGPPYNYVSLIGDAVRPWAVPLFYRILPNDGFRVTAQLLLSIASWLTLASVVAMSLRDRRVQVAGFALVLVATSAASVTNWDLIILSESLALSFSALCIAGWLRFVQQPTGLNTVATIAATMFLMFTRSQLVPVVAALAVATAIWCIRPAGRDYKLAMVMGLSFLCVWGLVVVRNVEHTSATRKEGVGDFSQNFVMVLQTRILTDPETLTWFREHGMPEPKGLAPPNPNDGGFLSVLRTYAANTELREWVETKGQVALIQHSIERPGKFPYQFAHELPGILTPARAETVYSPIPSVLPQPIEDIFTPSKERAGTPDRPAVQLPQTWFLAAFIGCAFLRRRRPVNGGAMAVVVGALIVAVGAFYVSWLISPMEAPRHAVPFTAVITLMLVVGALLFVDAACGASADVEDDASSEAGVPVGAGDRTDDDGDPSARDTSDGTVGTTDAAEGAAPAPDAGPDPDPDRPARPDAAPGDAPAERPSVTVRVPGGG